MSRFVALAMVAALSLTACAGSGSSAPAPTASSPVDAAVPAAAASPEPSAAAGEDVATVERSEPFRLVTLGDAYTHGTDTAAPRRDSWPAQVVETMRTGGVRVWLWNLAEQGQTSGRLLEDQLSQVASLEPDVVTLQVGVNDIIAREVDAYRENVGAAFDELLTILPPERILGITTPDHTLTEWGDAFAAREVGQAAVAELNDTLTEEAAARGIDVVDISAVNRLVDADSTLVIDEGPYPSAKQYAGWAEVIGPAVRDALAGLQP